jgi:hypothetical protein
MSFIQKHILTVIGVLVGAIAGYFYWQQIGCASGNCVITSNPVNSILYGALMGGLLFGMFKTKTKTTKQI